MSFGIVIHMILSPADGKREIPALLRGDAPPTDRKNNLGTQNYSKKAAAVILGGAFGDADIAAMREACRGDSKAPWLRLDLSKPTPPVGPEYGKAMVQRVKSCLKQLEIDGKLDGDSIYFY